MAHAGFPPNSAGKEKVGPYDSDYIFDSWFMKGELLFHILEHDGFISTSTLRKYTREERVSE